MWNLETGGERLALRGADDVMALTVTPDGRYVLTAAHGTWDLKVWDLENTTEPRTLSGHVAAISALAMMPGGLHAVSVSRDNSQGVGHKNLVRDCHVHGRRTVVRVCGRTTEYHRGCGQRC